MINKDLVLTENRLAKTQRQIERSLRTVVKENRQKMNPLVTEEQLGIRILNTGQ